MKGRVAAVAVICALVMTANGAFANEGDKAVEASLNFGTESFDDLGGQVGVTAGFGYEFKNNLQGRIDLSYFRSSSPQDDMDVTGARVPLDLGARYYYPLTNIDSDLTVYGQGGLEVSFDEWHPGPMIKARHETRFGGLIGAGAEYALAPHYSVTAHLQYHIIEGSYLSTGIGMAYRF